jgi:hypothetical protein
MAISRRTCLLALTLMVGVLLALPGGIELLAENERANAQVAERPNFVFVMTDDLDERSMEQLGGIRSVMNANGVTFENAYVAFSLCCPSRATFFRGQYPLTTTASPATRTRRVSRGSDNSAGTNPPSLPGSTRPATRPST